MGSNEAEGAGTEVEGGKNADIHQALQALRVAALGHAKCMEAECTRGDACCTLQSLKLASLHYTFHILDAIAAKRLGVAAQGGKASGAAMREVADELEAVAESLMGDMVLNFVTAVPPRDRC
jgi:hypothetical protein